MRKQATVALLFAAFSLFAQQKSVTPLSAPSTVDRPPATVTRAVVVGISDYQDPAIPDLRFADKDAEAFANFLRSPAIGGSGLDENHLRLLVNEKASTGQLVAAFDWLLSESKPGDLVVIYFSGHCDVETKYLRKPGFLLSWDAPARAYSAGALAIDNLQDVVQTLSAQNQCKVLLIADACHAGKLAGSAINGTRLAGAALITQMANEMKILSCQTDEVSLEGKQWGGGRGVFSYHLVDGLYGLADHNGDGQVDLLEIGRYLEDRVSADVAPQNQMPQVLGNKTEPVAMVNPALLNRLQQYKAGRLPEFSPIEGKGLEDEVLTQVDERLREQYLAFKLAVKNKQFFESPDGDGHSAEDYYTLLSAEPRLVALHRFMQRNYAAALQDDAQQAVNAILKINTAEVTKSTMDRMRQYSGMPRLLARAAELLGPRHYLYATLKARQLLFEGLTLYFETYASGEPETGARVIEKYRQSLQYQPESPLTHYYMSHCFAFKMNQPDSAYVHTRQAVHYAETWVLPYAHLAYFFARRYQRYTEAEDLLRQAMAIDSNSLVVWTGWGALYYYQDKYPEAIEAYQNVLRLDSTHALAWTNIGVAYLETGQYTQAETALRQALRINPRQFSSRYVLGCLYRRTGRDNEAEQVLLQAIDINPQHLPSRDSLAQLYIAQGRPREAEVQLFEMARLDPTLDQVWYALACLAAAENRREQALEYLEKYLEKGGRDFEYLQQDARLEPLRNLNAYKALLKKFFPERD